MLPHQRDLKEKARHLRKTMTDAEQVLWRSLRANQLYGIPFYRQKPIGAYIVDFYAPAARLVIEVDGSQHRGPMNRAQDIRRDAYLNLQGLKVLRIDDRQVLCEKVSVLERIEQEVEAALQQIPPHPPFSKGGNA